MDNIKQDQKTLRSPDKAHAKVYQCWIHLKHRCLNPKDKDYKYYGGPGITVCQQWIDSYESFLNHVGLAPTPEHSLDRIDNNGNYEPGNLRWATKSQQNTNRRQPLIKPITSPKITESDVLEIRSQRGITRAKVLGVKYNISASHISKIWRRVNWPHVKQL